MIGKTIVGVEQPTDYHAEADLILRFSDGTSARLQATGWEADGIDVTQESYVETMRRGAEAAGRREAERVERLAAEVKRREREALRASMTKPEWEAWLDEHEPGWRTGKLLSEMYEDAIRSQMQSMSLLMNRRYYDGEHTGGYSAQTFTVPIEREATSEDG
jgi:hypothetical protein